MAHGWRATFRLILFCEFYDAAFCDVQANFLRLIFVLNVGRKDTLACDSDAII